MDQNLALIYRPYRWLLLLILSLFVVVNHSVAEYSDAYYQRTVQTILDTEKNVQSSGKITVTTSEANEYLVRKSMNWRSYAIAHFPTDDPPRGLFKLTIGAHRYMNLASRWWKRIKFKPTKEFPRIEIWSRTVAAGGQNFIELLLREKRDHLGFEIRLVFKTSTGALSALLKRYRLFLKNAMVNRAFSPDSNASNDTDTNPAVVHNPVPGAHLNGTWSGPMRNTKAAGDTAASLVLDIQPDGEIKGTWYADWPLENATFDGKTLSWEHNRIGRGCRDYVNKLTIEGSGKKGLITYHVLDRCSEPKHYKGTHTITKQP